MAEIYHGPWTKLHDTINDGLFHIQRFGAFLNSFEDVRILKITFNYNSIGKRNLGCLIIVKPIKSRLHKNILHVVNC